MRERRSSLGVGILLFVVLASGSVVVALLVKAIAREKERAELSQTGQRAAQSERATLELRLKETDEALDRAESRRLHRETVVEGELVRLRTEVDVLKRLRSSLESDYRAAVGERDRALEDLLTARRDLGALRRDLATARKEERRSFDAAGKAGRRVEELEVRLAASTRSIRALLRPLLTDLRSTDGTLRVRASEALNAYVGRDLPYRPSGTPEEIDADARAIEALLLSD
ncbi:MAG: hypothetical protein ACYTG4_01060 [Planctomycetota bacterium]|jgi:chromosome segregation ATPase